MRKSVIISGVLAGVMLAGVAQARDYISISGSSTVLPFATIVAERLGRNPDFKTPVVESGGSSVGKKSVCDGVGTEFTDIGNASSYCTNINSNSTFTNVISTNGFFRC